MNIYTQGNTWPFLAWLELNNIPLAEADRWAFDRAYIGEYLSPQDCFDEPGSPDRIYYVMNEKKTGYYVFNDDEPGQNIDELHPAYRFAQHPSFE